MEVAAETKRRCTIEFLTTKDHIQVRGYKDPESIVCTFRCIQSTLPQVSLDVIYELQLPPYVLTICVRAYYVRTWSKCTCLPIIISSKLYS